MSLTKIPFNDLFGVELSEKNFKPIPSMQPFCPTAFILSQKEPVVEQLSFGSRLRMEFGNSSHDFFQQAISKRFPCFGDWVDSKGIEWKHRARPEGKEFKYQETIFPIPGVGRNTKPDMLINFDLPQGAFSLLEIKCVGKRPTLQPDRKHYLQANLTAYCVSQEIPCSDFFIVYIDRVDPNESTWTRYPLDLELAQIQIELMTGKIPMGICSCPGDWWCPFTEKCFLAGQSQKWSENPELARKLEKLKWPTESIL